MEITDDQVTQAIERIGNSAVDTQEKIEGIGTQSDQTTRKISQGFSAQEKAIVDTTRAADDYNRAISDNTKRIDRLNASVDKERKLLLELGKQYLKFGDTGTKEAIAVKKQLDILNASIKQSRDETEQLTEKNKGASVALQDIARSAKQSGKGLKDTGKESRGLGQTFRELFSSVKDGLFGPLLNKLPQVSSGLTGGSKAVRIFGMAAKSTLRSVLLLAGTFAIVAAAIIAVVALPLALFFTKSQKAMDFFADKVAYLRGVIDEIVNRFVQFGDVLFGAITGSKDFGDVMDAAANAVNGLGAALDAAGQAAQSYRILQERLKREMEDFIVAEGQVMAQLDEKRRLIDNETKSYSTRKGALREAMTLEKDLEAQRIKFAEANLQRVRNEATLTNDGEVGTAGLESIAKAERELIDLRRDAASRQFQDEKELISLNNEAVQKTKERTEALRDLQKEAENVLRQLEDMRRGDVSGIDKIRLDTIKAIDEVGKLEQSLRELYAEQGREFNLSGDFEATVQALQQRGAAAIRDFERQRSIQEARAAQERLDEQRQEDLSLIDQREELATALVDVDRKQGLTEIEGEQARQKQRLQIQIDYTRQRLALVEDQTSIEAALYRANIESLQQDIEGLGQADLTAVQQLGEKIRAALGLDAEQAQVIGDLFGQFGSTIIEASSAIIDAQIAEQDQLIEKYAERVDATKSALDEELKLREQGFANDAGLLEQNLVKEQAILEAAEAKKLTLQKKQAAAQLRIEAAQQASSYLTTVFNLLASESKTGIIGLIAVAAGGLALIGSIVSKAKANAAAFQAPGFKDGTPYVMGPGDGRSDSIPAYLSRGERVVDFQTNQRIGSVSNTELVKYFEIGKAVAAAPNFAGVDQRTQAAIKQGRDVSALEKENELRLMAGAFEKAATKGSKEMIAYWKSRPVTYQTEAGTVIEYEKGGVKVKQNIKKK